MRNTFTKMILAASMLILPVFNATEAKANLNRDYEQYVERLVHDHMRIVPHSVMNDRQILCLASNIYYEARGERMLGRLAVANVTMNRSQTRNMSVCNIVHERNQFSWTNFRMSRPSGELWHMSITIAWLAIRHPELLMDVTNNSTFFHATRIRNTPRDFRNLQRIVTIGNHHFYRLHGIQNSFQIAFAE